MPQSRFLTLTLSASLVAAACGSGAASPSTTVAATVAEEPTATTETEEVAGSEGSDQDPNGVSSAAAPDVDPSFDLLHTSVRIDGDDIVFRSQVVADAGTDIPEAVGALDQAPVWSYVWPTSLDSDAVGFESGQGILALAATAHPDFDDTPLYDENGDGDVANDGADWHAHWVVLVETETCAGGLSVKDIPEDETPTLPPTWPDLPI